MNRRARSLLYAGFACAALFAAWPLSAADGDVVVFVETFGVDKRVKENGDALASAFCAQLMKIKGVDVICAPDVRQMMDYAALQSMAGAGANTASPLERRLDSVEVVVRATLEKGKHGLILSFAVFDRNPDMRGSMVDVGKRRGVWQQRGIQGGAEGMLRVLPRLAKRIGALVVQAPQTPSAPPAPLD